MTTPVRPRMTIEPLPERSAPPCPHCGGSMDAASITLEDLAEAWPLPERVGVEADGYAHGHQELVVACPSCALPSAVAIDWRNVKLIAARTEKDDAYLAMRCEEVPL